MKRFMKHFLIPIIILVLLGIIALIFTLTSGDETYNSMAKRTDTYAAERVYDTANVLTDEEEGLLRELIVGYENECKSDLVVYTMDETLDNYGSTSNYTNTMKSLADSYYDDNNFGYEKAQGSGAILLIDFYRESNGDRHFYMSTSGYARDRIDGAETDLTTSNLASVGDDPYGAIAQYLRATKVAIKPGFNAPSSTVILILMVLVAISVGAHFWLAFYQKKADVTTTDRTYVEGGNGRMINQYDRFSHKEVTKVYSPQKKNSGSGGGGGGGGSHGGGGGSF